MWEGNCHSYRLVIAAAAIDDPSTFRSSHNIHVVIPPNLTHLLQPLAVVINNPLHDCYNATHEEHKVRATRDPTLQTKALDLKVSGRNFALCSIPSYSVVLQTCLAAGDRLEHPRRSKHDLDSFCYVDRAVGRGYDTRKIEISIRRDRASIGSITVKRRNGAHTQ